MSTKEINNGRLAMIGVAGMVAQELVNRKEIFVNAGLAADRFDTSSVPSEEPNYAFFIIFPGLLLQILALENRQKLLNKENIDKEKSGFSLEGLLSSRSKSDANDKVTTITEERKLQRVAQEEAVKADVAQRMLTKRQKPLGAESIKA